MTWQRTADEREGHSSPGAPSGATTWYFAEGDTGFATYLALLNLEATQATVRVEYLHANGTAYATDVAVPAYARATVPPPAWLPLGSFGYRITSLGGQAIVAERSMYGGPNWTLGTSGVGTPTPNPLWFFEEGGTGPFWDTYILLANPSPTPANVWLAFIRDDGALFWQYVAVAPNQRQSILVDAVPGVTAANFRTEVRSDIPVVAERVTYWPGDGTTFLTTSPTDLASPAADLMAPSEPSLGFNPYTTTRPRAPIALGRYHVLTDGVPVGDRERTLAAQHPEAPDSPTPVETLSGTAIQATPTDPTTTDPNGATWYGAHLTGGRRP